MMVNRKSMLRDASACGAHPLARFLCRFASDAECGHGSCLEPFNPDLVATFLAAAVNAAFNAGERFVDLGQKLAFAIAHAQQQSAVRLEGRAVCRIGVSLSGLLIHTAERTL